MSESREARAHEIAKIYFGETTDPCVVSASVAGSEKVLAGDDNRKDYFDATDAEQTLADATVILTDKSELTQQPDGAYKLDVNPFRRNDLPPCAGERFAKQHTGGWCSGFMVGEDIIVTAGHCGETEAEIQNTAYVFGFRVEKEGGAGTTQFSEDQVYFGKELNAHDLSEKGDFALVRVDRTITAENATPLKVRAMGRIGDRENVGVIGYPSGLPVKIAFGQKTVVLRHEDPWLISNLDTYGGNSGSPVFSKNGLVEGILVRGAQDYNFDGQEQCFRSNRIENKDGSEAVTKSSAFVSKIPTAANGPENIAPEK